MVPISHDQFCKQNIHNVLSREPVVMSNFQFPEKEVVHNFIVFEKKNPRIFYWKRLFYLIVPRDVK